MKCVEAKKQIDLLIDDQLTFAESENLEKHFASCTSCRYSYEKLLLVRNGLRNQPKCVPSKALDTKILQVFANHHQQQQKPTFWQLLTLPKFSFAQTLPILLIGIASAFLLGKFAFSNEAKIVEISQPPIVKTEIVEKEVEKIVPQIVTVTKIVKLPIKRSDY